MRIIVAAALIPLLGAQSNPGADALLAAIRQSMRENLQRLPDYTCRLTIERTTRPPNSRHASRIDTVRVEVGYVEGKELYAWPGQKFGNQTLDQMMPPGGALGTGDFALHVRSIFLGNAANFSFAGRSQEEGREVVQFDFRVPRAKSRYVLKSGGMMEVVGYHGSFRADVRTLRLLRLEIEVDDVPPGLRIDRAGNRLTYSVTRIGGADFLLPASSELFIQNVDGRENRNLTRFEQCRQYQGESVLSFADPGAVAEAAHAITEVQLPAGLLVEMTLRSPLILERAVIGDPIRAVVVHDVVKAGEVVIPKGATVTGRITRVGHGSNGRINYQMTGLRLTSVDFPYHHADFVGSLESVGYAAAQITIASTEEKRYGLGPGEGMLFVRGNVYQIPAGAHMTWRTLSDSN